MLEGEVGGWKNGEEMRGQRGEWDAESAARAILCRSHEDDTLLPNRTSRNETFG
jgi:hypothetical protein